MVPNAMPIFTNICQVKAKLMIGERAENVMVVAEIMVIEDKGMQGWKWKSFSHVRLFATPWTIQSMEFFRPEYWSG